MNGTMDDPLEKQWHISLRIQRYISNQTLKKEEKVGAMTDDVNEVNLTAMWTRNGDGAVINCKEKFLGREREKGKREFLFCSFGEKVSI